MMIRFFIACLLLFTAGKASTHDLYFTTTPSFTYFPEPALYPQQSSHDSSLRLLGNYEHRFGKAKQFIFNLEAFMRYSTNNHNLQHFDFRTLNIKFIKPHYTITVGIEKIHFGVTESGSIVDIVNQIDFLESFISKEKLGQPMVRVSTRHCEYGNIDFFALSFFREQKYPGVKGRLRPPFPISKEVNYDSSKGKKHIDFASRWSVSKQYFDLALSYFQGTKRNPDLNLSSLSKLELQPFYPQIKQGSIEFVLLPNFGLLKFEGVYSRRKLRNLPRTAYTVGFEKSFLNIFSSDASIITFVEYSNDHRRPSTASVYKHELFAGAAFNFNDVNETKARFGFTTDVTTHQRVESLGLVRRLGDSLSLKIDGVYIEKTRPSGYLYPFRKDSFVEVRLDYFWKPAREL